MDTVEIQLARLTALFEASRAVEADHHRENVTRLVRIEGKQDITNGRVTELEKRKPSKTPQPPTRTGSRSRSATGSSRLALWLADTGC